MQNTQIYKKLVPIATAIGSIWAAYQAYKIASFCHLYFLRRSTIKRYLKPARNGEQAWALVTGATDGIGRGFAEELCQQGFNVIIHGRNPAKLEREKSKLLSRWPNCSVRTLCIDASAEGGNVEALKQAASNFQSLNLCVLVNNVGGTGGLRAFAGLHERSTEEVRQLIDMNARFPTEITQALLPQLRQNTPSLIINVSSAASILGIPYLGIYSAAKAYNKTFSQCLSSEMKADGVEVEVIGLLVAAVATDYYNAPQGLFVPNASKLAKAALGVVGCGRSIVYPYWGHCLQGWIVELLPEMVRQQVAISTGKQQRRDEESGKTSGKKNS